MRPDPAHQGQYLVVYGRRRLNALKTLGLPAKALVRDLDDEKALIAQGQENTQRRNLSFIEKARFAREMEQLGYERKIICDSLAIDKSEISRMLKVIETVPENWILAIGSAPSVGRDRWLKFGEMIRALDAQDDALIISDPALDSDARFQRSYEDLEKQIRSHGRPAPKTLPPNRPLKGKGGVDIGTIKRSGNSVKLEFDPRKNDGFEEWLIGELPKLHEKFLKSKS